MSASRCRGSFEHVDVEADGAAGEVTDDVHPAATDETILAFAQAEGDRRPAARGVGVGRGPPGPHPAGPGRARWR